MWELIKSSCFHLHWALQKTKHIMLAIIHLTGWQGKENLPIVLIRMEHHSTIGTVRQHKWEPKVLMSVLLLIFRIRLGKSVLNLPPYQWNIYNIHNLILILSVFYCCIRNHHKITGFKQHQKSKKCSLPRFSQGWDQSRCQPVRVLTWRHWGNNPLPSSCRVARICFLADV